jgi:hypothetical protein
MDEVGVSDDQKKLVTMYALLNQISWTCENGIQFNQNTQPVVDRNKEYRDKIIIEAIRKKLKNFK